LLFPFCLTKLKLKHAEAKRKRETEVTFNTYSSGKRHADKIEAAPDAKRQVVEASTGSPKKSILPRVGALSRETSFKGLDRLRGKLNHQTSFSDDTESARSAGSQLQPPKGRLHDGIALPKRNSTLSLLLYFWRFCRLE